MHTTQFDNDYYSVDMAIKWSNTHGKQYIQSIPVADLVSIIDQNVWILDGDQRISPREVIDDPGRSPRHTQKIYDADLSFPPIVVMYHGHYEIFDGIHRLCKHIQRGDKEISVIVMPEYVFVRCKIGSWSRRVTQDKMLVAMIDAIIKESNGTAAQLLSNLLYDIRFNETS